MNYEKDLLRGALTPTLVVAVMTVGYSTWAHGVSGALAGALAQLVIVAYLVLHIFVAKVTKNLDPLSTMSLALVSYFGKIVVLGLFLLFVSRMTTDETIHRGSFALCAIAGAFAWLFGEIRAYLKLKIHLPLPTPPSVEGGSESTNTREGGERGENHAS